MATVQDQVFVLNTASQILEGKLNPRKAAVSTFEYLRGKGSEAASSAVEEIIIPLFETYENYRGLVYVDQVLACSDADGQLSLGKPMSDLCDISRVIQQQVYAWSGETSKAVTNHIRTQLSGQIEEKRLFSEVDELYLELQHALARARTYIASTRFMDQSGYMEIACKGDLMSCAGAALQPMTNEEVKRFFRLELKIRSCLDELATKKNTQVHTTRADRTRLTDIDCDVDDLTFPPVSLINIHAQLGYAIQALKDFNP